METDISTIEMVGRLLLAMLAGAALGWEREVNGKPAGLRTHILVALGSSVFIVASLQFLYDHRDIDNSGMVLGLDPFRVVQGIVGGIGFLGAGSIIRGHSHVRGITTAAGIWVTAAIGVACGMGYYRIVLCSVTLGLATMVLIGHLERYLFRKRREAKQARNDELAKEDVAGPD